MSKELQTVEATSIARLPRLDVPAITERVASIERVIDKLMVKGKHYGPPFKGSKKDSLLQPGAELLFEGFGMVPESEITEVALDGDHRRFICEGWILSSSGAKVGRLSAECSTMESKYRWRKGGRECPECGALALKKSNYPDRDTGLKGWYCHDKSGGCGGKFPASKELEEQEIVAKVENPDIADLWHTCRMMSQKRWLVAIARRTFGLSARFVDEEGAGAELFDWSRLAPVLRSLPGERDAKWAAVCLQSLQEFGKKPRELTNLEGAVIMDGLARQVTTISRDDMILDFGPSPEEPEKGGE